MRSTSSAPSEATAGRAPRVALGQEAGELVGVLTVQRLVGREQDVEQAVVLGLAAVSARAADGVVQAAGQLEAQPVQTTPSRKVAEHRLVRPAPTSASRRCGTSPCTSCSSSTAAAMSSRPSRLRLTEADLDDDGTSGRGRASASRPTSRARRRDEDPVVRHAAYVRASTSVRRGLPGRTTRPTSSGCSVRGSAAASGRELVRRRGGHEQRTDVGGIRPRAPVEVLAHGHVERGEARREHRGVVDEAVEERRERQALDMSRDCMLGGY